MTFSLDTNVIIDVVRGVRSVRDRLDEAVGSGADVFVSVIALEELQYGAMISVHPQRAQADYEKIVASLAIAPLTASDAGSIGEYRARQERGGRRMSAFDGLIAGQAFARGWTVVTADHKLAGNALDITIENWRAPA